MKSLDTRYSSVHSRIIAYTFQWDKGNVEVAYKLLRVWVFTFISSPLGPGLSLSHIHYREDFTKFSSQLGGMTLIQFWGYLSSPGVMNRILPILKILWKCILSTFHPRTSPDTENLSGSSILLGAQAGRRIQWSLQGFTCAITVSALHYASC